MTDLGVYAGPGAKGVAAANTFAAVTGGRVLRRGDFLPNWSWTDIATTSGVFYSHSNISPTPLPLDVAVPLLPQQAKTAGETLRDISLGKRDDIWRRFAGTVAGYSLKFPITLRLGWEFNGSWYPWTAAGQESDFAEAFRHVAAIVRDAVSVVNGDVELIWCVSNGTTSAVPKPDSAWPGADYVDAVGVDFYDYSWLYPLKGYGKDVRDKVWASLTSGTYSLSWWADFAQAHGKPLVLPEWGPGIKSDGTGGGDNADFVHRTLTAVQHLGVAWATYFETGGSTVEHRISVPETRLPLCLDAFRQRMSSWAFASPTAGLRTA